MDQIREEINIKRQEKLRLKLLEKKRENYNRILKQILKMQMILEDEEKTRKEKYDETKTLEVYNKKPFCNMQTTTFVNCMLLKGVDSNIHLLHVAFDSLNRVLATFNK